MPTRVVLYGCYTRPLRIAQTDTCILESQIRAQDLRSRPFYFKNYMIYYIYKITLTEGSLKGHYYIGQRKFKGEDIKRDWYKGSGVIVNDYYKKYPNAFIKEILEICSEETLNDREAFYVGDLWETDPLCLNLRAGGKFPGVSTESRYKMSIHHKTPGFKGKTHSEESKQKMRDALIGRTLSLEHKIKIQEAHLAKSKPKKDKELKGRKHSEETRKKIGDALRGKAHPQKSHGAHSEETRKKISEALKKKYLEGWNPKLNIHPIND